MPGPSNKLLKSFGVEDDFDRELKDSRAKGDRDSLPSTERSEPDSAEEQKGGFKNMPTNPQPCIKNGLYFRNSSSAVG